MISWTRLGTRSCVLALALSPWALGVGCSDDSGSEVGDGGSSGSSGAGASGGDASVQNAGSGGQGGAAGSSTAGGSGGSAGAQSSAGSGGSMNTMDAGAGADSGGSDASVQAFRVSSPAFDDNPGCGPDNRAACDLFPDENTGLGQARNVSPAINWTPGPAGTQSYAIALHDLTYFDMGTDPYTHWVMWDIPGSTTELPAELPEGASPPPPAPVGSQQISFSGTRYTGSGACGNVYEFVLYALSTPTFTPNSQSSPDAVEAALQASSAVLGTATMHARSDPNGPSCN